MKVPLTRLIHGNPVVWVPLTRSIRGNPVICVPLVFAMVTSLLGPLGLAAQEKLEETTLGFPSGRQVQAELAVSEEQRARGLMFRDSLDSGRGMLFVFPQSDFHVFWMKNCQFPIDILWLSPEKKIVHIERAVPPCKEDPCPSYGPMRKAKYVVEVVANFSRDEKLRLGDAIDFDTP